MHAATAPVVGISPIVGGAVVRGMADKLLPAVGAEVSAVGVARALQRPARRLGHRHPTRAAPPTCDGHPVVAITDTMMDDVDVAAALARTCLDLAAAIREADA
jgi:LPPG:FO 2-phospho-L-lactate transferase